MEVPIIIFFEGKISKRKPKRIFIEFHFNDLKKPDGIQKVEITTKDQLKLVLLLELFHTSNAWTVQKTL